MEKICPECGESFVGRADKIYCCDSCRANHNNRIYRDADGKYKAINRKLLRNRKVLAELVAKGKTVSDRRQQALSDFDGRVWTSSRKRFLFLTEYHCYEYSYYIIGHNLVHIRKLSVTLQD